MGPTRFTACSARAAVVGTFAEVNAILDEIANELLTALPRGIN
jgi:hypothetical protein